MKKWDVEFAIIGAGFSGLGMAVRLKQAGYDSFLIFERADELGGTWRDNIYPGCACDIPSIVYSFSFDQNPNWSRKYPTQPELLAYLKACAQKFNIRQQIRFNAEVNCLTFNEADGVWLVETADGQQLTARFVVSAIGPLNRPNIPPIPGLDSFPGPQFHSSEWDPQFDPAGQRIAAVGTGASAIQFIPQLAQTAVQLTVFQRTPPWIVPRDDFAISERRKRLFQQFPVLQKIARFIRYWKLEIGVLGFLGNERVNQLATNMALEHMKSQIPDPELRQKVTPDYAFGCKRALVSDDYYPALMQPNVELVTSGLTAVDGNRVIDRYGTAREVDAIIFGTGFVAAELLIDMVIEGRNGRLLLDEWQQTGPEAYMGISVSGFPNLFWLLGPNTGLGHNSVMLMVEAQYNYILDYVSRLEQQQRPFFDVTPQAQAQFVADTQQKLAQTVWQSGGCSSWYQMASGKNSTLWPGSTFGYRAQTKQIDIEAFE